MLPHRRQGSPAPAPFNPPTSPQRVLGLLGLPHRRSLSPSSLARWHVTVKRFGVDTSPEVGRGHFDEGSALTSFSALTLGSTLTPFSFLTPFLAGLRGAGVGVETWGGGSGLQ